MSLTLGNLRQQLAKLGHLSDDTAIVISKDGGGNEFSPLDEVETAMYLPDTDWSGERYETGDAPEDATSAIFLWPTH